MGKVERIFDLVSYAMTPQNSAFYVGWLGEENLGDEILEDAVRELVAPLGLATLREHHVRFLDGALSWKKHSVAILGGGTQIGEASPIDRFRKGLALSRTGVVFGAGVTPAEQETVPGWLEAWGEILRPLPYVGVRGIESAATLRKVGVAAEALGDPVCHFSQDAGYWSPAQGVFGVNIGHSFGHMYGDEERIQTSVAAYLRRMAERGWHAEFFCIWPEDLAVTRKVAEAAGMPGAKIHKIYHDARIFLEQARRMTFFAGIKLHAVALATCANVPSLMFEYRPKCREFMMSIGQQEFVRRTDELDVDDLAETSDTLVKDGPAISTSIRTAMMPIRNRLQEVGALVASLAGQK